MNIELNGVTVKIDEKQAVERFCEIMHRALWGWLAETGDWAKQNWPQFQKLPAIINHCFACESIGWRGVEDCIRCPLPFEPQDGTSFCENDGGWYQKWWEGLPEDDINCGDEIAEKAWRMMCAAQIRDMPWTNSK